MEIIVTDSLAQDYANGLLETIRGFAEEGTVFGWKEGSYADTGEDYKEEATAFDYLEEVLDFRYIVNGERRFIGAQLLLTFGGPNTWLDTITGEITVYWGSDVARVYAPQAFTDELNETLEQFWNMGV